MGDRHLTRRELLDAIPILGRGGVLLPLLARSARAAPPHGILRGTLRDEATGQPVSAKMRVTDAATGEPYLPASCIKSMPRRPPSGVRYFYVHDGYEIAVPAGRYRVEVVRGICHEPAITTFEVAPESTRVHDFTLKLVRDLHRDRWYSGNTHTHYNVDIEEPVDDRLRIVPPAEGLD